MKDKFEQILEEIKLLAYKSQEMIINKKVFLGGTANKTTWREELIPMLEIPYFNPVVEDWTEECIKIENDEKENKCGVHLYVITPEILGVYSIAEAVQSSNSNNKKTIFVFKGDIDPNTGINWCSDCV